MMSSDRRPDAAGDDAEGERRGDPLAEQESEHAGELHVAHAEPAAHDERDDVEDREGGDPGDRDLARGRSARRRARKRSASAATGRVITFGSRRVSMSIAARPTSTT